MPGTLITVWLIGDADADGLGALADALGGQGCGVELIARDRAHGLAETADAANNVALPNLIVVAADLAFAEDKRILQLLTESTPWTWLPVVVAARADDEARRGAIYDAGAAAWIVVPPESDARREVADVFARYWARACIVPDTSYFRR